MKEPDPEIGEIHYHDETGQWMVLSVPNENAVMLARIHELALNNRRPLTLDRLTEALAYLETRRQQESRRLDEPT